MHWVAAPSAEHVTPSPSCHPVQSMSAQAQRVQGRASLTASVCLCVPLCVSVCLIVPHYASLCLLVPPCASLCLLVPHNRASPRSSPHRCTCPWPAVWPACTTATSSWAVRSRTTPWALLSSSVHACSRARAPANSSSMPPCRSASSPCQGGGVKAETGRRGAQLMGPGRRSRDAQGHLQLLYGAVGFVL